MILLHPISTLFPYTTLFRSLIFETKNIDRDSGFVSAHTNLKKLSTFSVGIFHCVKSISNRRVGNRKRDRKSTRLNSSHTVISYAVFCLKKKKKIVISEITIG